MNYQLACSIFVGFALSISCAGPKETEERFTESFQMHPSHYQCDFSATDADSTWKLSIQFGGELLFTSKTDKIIFKGNTDPEVIAQGADIVMVKAVNSEYEIIAIIDIQKCNETGKHVTVSVKNLTTKQEIEYNGCGYYNGTPKLYDIWVLFAINEQPLSEEAQRLQLPFAEINLKDKTIMGFGGCNEFNGQLSFSYNKIHIQPLVATRKYCDESSQLEEKFLGLMNNETLNYQFKGNILILESQKGSLFLKKVD